MRKFGRSKLTGCSSLGITLVCLALGCSSPESGSRPPETGSGLGGSMTSGGNLGNGGSVGAGEAATTGGTGANVSASGAPTGGAPTNGGSNAFGGTQSAGGSFRTDISNATGGIESRGGTSSSGALSSTGGTKIASGGTNSGGAANTSTTSTGGTRANGGGVNTGGTRASGGSVNTGGTSASGSGVSSGGITATGGVSSTPGWRIVGRTAAGTNGSARFSWPGVTITARFTGTQISMDINDGNNKNRFTVVIDGGTPKTVTSSSATSLSLATGLSSGTHDVVIWRNTEASPGGVTEFVGLSNFGSGGALLAPPAAQDRRIEVIGDSLSVGAGVEGSSTTCSPSIDAFTNNYLAYGSIAARSVGADVVTVAWSGIGVYRSYTASDPSMPARYDYAIASDQSPWDFSKYQPQVVVINLGTNDFGSGNPGQAFVDAYVNFAQHVRSKYSGANMILIDMYGGDRATAIKSVITTLKNSGESKVEMLSFSTVPNNNTACNQHPNTAAQKAMGDLLATRLKSLMGW